jgi:hypothetical protein
MLIYGQEKFIKADGILLKIENINRHGYVFFDSYPDPNERSGEKQYMLALIAPKINYFESLKIREIFLSMTKKINQARKYNINELYQKLLNILTTSSI